MVTEEDRFRYSVQRYPPAIAGGSKRRRAGDAAGQEPASKQSRPSDPNAVDPKRIPQLVTDALMAAHHELNVLAEVIKRSKGDAKQLEVVITYAVSVANTLRHGR